MTELAPSDKYCINGKRGQLHKINIPAWLIAMLRILEKMKTKNVLIVCFVIALLALPCFFGQFAEAKKGLTITMQDLGSIPGNGVSTDTTVSAINDKGQVVGTSGGHAFIWTQKDGMRDLGIDAYLSSALSINNKGEVIGFFFTLENDQFSPHDFLWTEKNGLIELDCKIPDSIMNVPSVINDKGQIVWVSIDKANDRHIFLWSDKTGMVEIEPLPPCTGYSGLSINNKGQVAACPHYYDVNYPFLWTTKTGVIELSPIFGTSDIRLYSINDKGEFVGAYFPDSSTGYSHTYLYSPKTGIHDLGSPVGEIESQALAVNNKGQIVGNSWVDYNTRHAYYWDTKSGYYILETPLGTITTDVADINNKGQVIGTCTVTTSEGITSTHAILWAISK